MFVGRELFVHFTRIFEAKYMEAILKNKVNAKGLGIVLAVALAVVLAFILSPAKAFAASTTFSLPVQQIFTATPGSTPDSSFDYVLERVGSAEGQVLPVAAHPMPAGTIGNIHGFTMDGNQTTSLDLTFTRAGFYVYEVRAASNDRGSDYNLDDTVFIVTIAVANDDNGGLEASVRRVQYRQGQDGELSAKIWDNDGVIVFRKAYAGALEAPTPTDPALMVDPPVRKTVQGNPATAYTFTFRLEAAEAGQPMPPGSTGRTKDLTITGSGSAEFGVWSYTEVGTFVYTVREIATDNTDYVFDTTVYTITDIVTNADGQLVLNRTVTNQDNRAVSSLIFINFFVGDDVEVQEVPPVAAPPGAGTRPTPGPKTGDYDDPMHMIIAMTLSGLIVLTALVLIYADRRSEDEHGDIAAKNVVIS